MEGEEDELAGLYSELGEDGALAGLLEVRDEAVDHGVADEGDFFGRHTFREEVVDPVLGGREEEVRDGIGQFGNGFLNNPKIH